MTTTSEAVERYLATDVALVDLLTRRIVNLRATARWLIEEHGWDATEEAVVSALRRYTADHPEAPLARDRDLLAETLVDVHTGLATITLPRTKALHEEMPELWSSIEALDTLTVTQARKRCHLLAEDDKVDTVREVLPAGTIEEVDSPISAIRLTLPEEPTAVALVGHAVAMLVHRGIEVHDVLTCLPEAWILVEGEVTMDAFERVAALANQPDVD